LHFGLETVTWTRQRPTDGTFVFLLARVGHVMAGEPVLSDEHSELAWLDQDNAARLAFPPHSSYRDAIPALWRMTE